MTPQHRSPWTPEADNLIRERYVSDGASACAEALGRTWTSITRRAKRLAVVRVRRWSTHDDARLMLAWGVHPIAIIARSLERTEDAVYWRAKHLDLGLGCPQGKEYLSGAAQRTGYAVSSLRMILRWAKVRIERATTRPDAKKRGRNGAGRHHFVVEPHDVDRAVGRWHATESLDRAAESRGVGSSVLARLLVEAIGRGDRRVPPKPCGFRKHWRIPSAIVDELLSAYQGRETLGSASIRVGVNRQTLHSWLTRAGVSVAKVGKLDAAAVDRVVAKHRADPRCRAPRMAA